MIPEAARPPQAISKVAVEPFECIRAGYSLIVTDGRLGPAMGLFGLLFVSMLIPYGSIVLLGPAMCGFYYVIFKWIREEEAGPKEIFKGFEWMWESFAATLITVFISAAITFPLIALMVGFGYLLLAPTILAGGTPSGGLIAVVIIGGYGSILFCSMLVRILLAFTYPLIAERGLQPLDAIKWSFRGASAHIPGLFALAVLNGLISFVGFLFCVVPGLLYVPIAIASMAFAHVKIFGLADEPSYRQFENEADSNRPPRGTKRSQWQSLDSLDPNSERGQEVLFSTPAESAPEAPSTEDPPAAEAPAWAPLDAPREDLKPAPEGLDAADTVPPATPPPALPDQDTVPPASSAEDSVASMREQADAEIDKTVHPPGDPAPKPAPIDPAPLMEAAEIEVDRAVKARFPTPEFGVAETRLMTANPSAADALAPDADEVPDEDETAD